MVFSLQPLQRFAFVFCNWHSPFLGERSLQLGVLVYQKGRVSATGHELVTSIRTWLCDSVRICSVHHRIPVASLPSTWKTWQCLPSAAAWPCALKVLQDADRTVAPRIWSVSMNPPVWRVMCKGRCSNPWMIWRRWTFGIRWRTNAWITLSPMCSMSALKASNGPGWPTLAKIDHGPWISDGIIERWKATMTRKTMKSLARGLVGMTKRMGTIRDHGQTCSWNWRILQDTLRNWCERTLLSQSTRLFTEGADRSGYHRAREVEKVRRVGVEVAGSQATMLAHETWPLRMKMTFLGRHKKTMRTEPGSGPWATREKMFACVKCARFGVVFRPPVAYKGIAVAGKRKPWKK